MRICQNCGKAIPESRQANAIYCSKKCNTNQSTKRWYHSKKGQEWYQNRRKSPWRSRICRSCGGVIPEGRSLNAIHCSRACAERTRQRSRIEYNREYKRQHYLRNKTRYAERCRCYRSRHRVSINVRSALQRRVLSDRYVKSVVCQQTGLTHKDIPPALVELTRQQLRLRRAIYRKEKQQCTLAKSN